MESLTDTVAVITGASAGIGRATARELPEDIAFAIRTVLEKPRRLRTQDRTLWSRAQGS